MAYDPFRSFDEPEQGTAPAPSTTSGQISGVVEPLISGLGSGLSTLPKQMVVDPLRALGIMGTPSQEELVKQSQEEQVVEPKFSSFLPKWIYQAAQMMPASLAPTLAGAGTGAMIGGIPGALIGGVAGGLGGAGLFGLQQAQSTKEQAIRQGVDPGMAPLLTGLTEGGLEALSNLVLGGVAGKLLKAPLRQTGTALIRPLLKNVAELGIGEVLPEMAQAGIEAGIEKGYGIRPEADPLQEALDVIGPTALMSIMAGGGMGLGSKLLPKTLPEGYGQKALQTGVTDIAPPAEVGAIARPGEATTSYPNPRDLGMLGMPQPEPPAPGPWGESIVRTDEPREEGPFPASIVLPPERPIEPSSGGAAATLKQAMTEGEPSVSFRVDLKSGRVESQAEPVKPTPAAPRQRQEVPVQDQVTQMLGDIMNTLKQQDARASALEQQLAQRNAPVEQTLPTGNMGMIMQPPVAEPLVPPMAAPPPKPVRVRPAKPVTTATVTPQPAAKVTPVVEKKAPVVAAIPNAEPVPYIGRDSKQSTALQSTPSESLDKREGVIAFMNKDTGKVLQDKEGIAHTGWKRAGIQEHDLDNWISGWTNNGMFETGEMAKARLARQAAEGEQHAYNTGRSLGIKATAERAIPNKTIAKLAKIASDKLGDQQKVEFDLVGKDASQGMAAIKMATKRENVEGMPVASVLPDGTHTYAFDQNTLSVKKNDQGQGYRVTFETQRPVTQQATVAKEATVPAPVQTGVKPENVVAGRIPAPNKDILLSGKLTTPQAKNPVYSILANHEFNKTPAIVVGNVVHTPEGRFNMKGEYVGPHEKSWADTIQKYSPTKSNVSSNLEYRQAWAEAQPAAVAPVKKAPVARSIQRAEAPKPVPKSAMPTAAEKRAAVKARGGPVTEAKATKGMSDLEKQAEWVAQRKQAAEEPVSRADIGKAIAARKAADAEFIKSELERKKRVKEGTSSEPSKVEPKEKVPEPRTNPKLKRYGGEHISLDDIKFEGRTITTPDVKVTFPKDVERGQIKVEIRGAEHTTMPGTALADPKKVASKIAVAIAQQHENLDIKDVHKRVLEEITGEKESNTKAQAGPAQEEGAKEQGQKEKEVSEQRTFAPYVEQRFGNYLTLKEFVSTLPKENLQSPVSFLNRVREAMDMRENPTGWKKFHEKHALALSDMRVKELSTPGRSPNRNMALLRKMYGGNKVKSNWLGNVVDMLTSTKPKQAVQYTNTVKNAGLGTNQKLMLKLGNSYLTKYGSDVQFSEYKPHTVEQMATAQAVKDIGNIFKKQVVIYDVIGGKDMERYKKNLSGATDGTTIFINSRLLQSQGGFDAALHTTLGHEIVHTLETEYPYLYDKLKATVMSSPVFLENAKQLAAFTGNNKDVTNELIADSASKFLFDKEFWTRLSKQQPTVFEKLVGMVREFIRRVLHDLKFVTETGNQALRDRYGENIRKSLDGFDRMVRNVMLEYSRNRNNKFGSTAAVDNRLSGMVLGKLQPASFKNWFGKSVLTEDGKPRTLFHGTIKNIDNWNTNRNIGSIDQRLGAHFAFDPRLADQFSLGQYTDFSEASNKEHLLFDETDNSYHLPGGRVYPVIIKAENPLDLSSSKLEDWQQIQYDAFNRLFKEGHKKSLFVDTYSTLLGMNPEALNTAWSEMSKNNAWDKFFFEHDLPHLQEIDPSNKSMVQAADNLARSYKSALRAAGYDGVIYKHTDQDVTLKDPRAIIVFDSNQVKPIYTESNDGSQMKDLMIGSWQVSRDIPDIHFISSNPIADAEFEKNRGLGSISKWEKIKEYGRDVVKDFTRQFVHLDPKKYGDIANTLYKFKYSGDYGQKIAVDMLRDVVRGLTPGRYGVFRRMIVMPDLIRYMEGLQRNPKFAGQPVMGFNNVAEARTYFDEVKQAANDPAIKAALIRRDQMMKNWRDQMVAAKILPDWVLEDRRQDYFRHQVLDWMGAKALGEEPTLLLGSQGESVRLRKAGWQQSRKGTLHAYNTEYLEAEYEVLAQGIHQLEAKAALDHLKAYDKWKDFHDQWKAQKDSPGGEKDFKLFVKNLGYDFWQPRKGNFLHKAWTLTDKALDRVMAEQRTFVDEDGRVIDGLTGEEIDVPIQNLNISQRGLNRETVQGRPLPTWVLPDPVVKQLNQLEPPPDDSVLAKATAKTLGAWKQWVLFNPLRLTKYVFNNTSGDLDIAFAYDPKIITKFSKQAAIDLWKYTRDPGTLAPSVRAELEHALKQRVIDAGITFEEIGGIGKLAQSDIFKYLESQHTDLWQKFKESPGDYMKFVKKWANYRENILRLAAYRYFQQRVASGNPVYAASKRAEIDQITNADDKAAKLARELIGDYGNISRAGQWIRKHMIPFWSWLEINAPRYMRILQNSTYEGDPTGVGVRGAMVASKKVAMTGLKASALFGAIVMFNHVMFPDEDDELRKTGRGQLQLILGRRSDGTIRTLRIQGALSDALQWFGAENLGGDFMDIVKGRKSIWRQVKETAIAPVQRIALGARPMERTLSEMALGKTMWPDLTNPRPIRDSYEHFFKSISMDIPYRYIVGKPVKGLTEDSENLLFYKADPGEAAYYKTMQKAREFLEDKNVELPESSPTRRSNALYYYKQAKKFGDKSAETYWLDQFKAEGGKMQNVLQSIKKAHPMAFMPIKYRGQFMSTLDDEEKDVYKMAVNWWSKTYLSK